MQSGKAPCMLPEPPFRKARAAGAGKARRASLASRIASSFSCCHVRDDKFEPQQSLEADTQSNAVIDYHCVLDEKLGSQDSYVQSGVTLLQSTRSFRERLDTSPSASPKDADPKLQSSQELIREAELQEERDAIQLELERNVQQVAQLQTERTVMLNKIEQSMDAEAQLAVSHGQVKALEEEFRSQTQMDAAALREAVAEAEAVNEERNSLRMQAEKGVCSVAELEAELDTLKSERDAMLIESQDSAEPESHQAMENERDELRHEVRSLRMQLFRTQADVQRVAIMQGCSQVFCCTPKRKA